jgi:hypothetical protein
MTPIQTLHKAQQDFHDLDTDAAPVDACVRKSELGGIQRTMRELVGGLTVAVTKRKITFNRSDFSKGMINKERSQEKLIATCQTFLEELAAKHAKLTESHDALTCVTCRHRALMRSSDPADRAAAWELQQGRNAEIVAHKALLEARRIYFKEQAAEIRLGHCMHY